MFCFKQTNINSKVPLQIFWIKISKFSTVQNHSKTFFYHFRIFIFRLLPEFHHSLLTFWPNGSANLAVLVLNVILIKLHTWTNVAAAWTSMWMGDRESIGSIYYSIDLNVFETLNCVDLNVEILTHTWGIHFGIVTYSNMLMTFWFNHSVN